MNDGVRIAIAGAGMIGRIHAERVTREATLCAIVDPAPGARDYAASLGVACYDDLAALFASGRPEGVIVASPTRLHVPQALECVAAGLPVLVEKPIAGDALEAARLVGTASAAGVPVLVGHHRRHNPIASEAKEAIASGRLGDVVAVHATCWFHKPRSYFAPEWRRQAGAGPVLTNMIHDVDLMRFLCGEVTGVQARQSARTRGHGVEDTAVAILEFASGALGTLSVSDTISAPWSWELTARENPAFPFVGASCYQIGGTRGSLSVPDFALWHYDREPDWQQPLLLETLTHRAEDPYTLQIRHFAAVIRDGASPLVSGEEGLKTLQVVSAIKRSAETGAMVAVEEEALGDGAGNGPA